MVTKCYFNDAPSKLFLKDLLNGETWNFDDSPTDDLTCYMPGFRSPVTYKYENWTGVILKNIRTMKSVFSMCDGDIDILTAIGCRTITAEAFLWACWEYNADPEYGIYKFENMPSTECVVKRLKEIVELYKTRYTFDKDLLITINQL